MEWGEGSPLHALGRVARPKRPLPATGRKPGTAKATGLFRAFHEACPDFVTEWGFLLGSPAVTSQ